MWKMTPEFCNLIHKKKSKNVVITLTDYNRDRMLDRVILNIVKQNYETVYAWPQGIYDQEYIKELDSDDRIIILQSSLEAYTKLLSDNEIDYVGTRFHGGIYAMRHGARSIIISLDERMNAMTHRIENNYILRDNVCNELDEKINSEIDTKVSIDFSEIEKWKGQFT